ncbi:MAG: GNAT family N-acetyltransferase [Candidatus Heimdallarchaeota archaeon]|nr:MAG: GNAT family N-acetyltransferase [Candidatus Heimdallarchaeota archaeon]
MRLIELKIDDFSRVRSLFSTSKHLRFTIDAVIAGNSPGRIWVDNPNDPSKVFLWDGFHCYYLVGTPDNVEFNVALKKLLLDEIIPEAISRNREVFKIEYSPNEWESFIKETLKGKLPIKTNRSFFVFNANSQYPSWRDILPNDFQVRKIDRELLESNIGNIESIFDEINECWYSFDDFLQNGFGFCIIYDQKNGDKSVQGWCTGEYFSEGKCGIGIMTFRKFQNRGFATAMASEFVDFAVSKGIQPHWDAWTSNYASIRVARKVGFEKIEDYHAFMGSFINSEGFLGTHFYQKEEFETAARWFEKAAALGQRQFANYYDAACSWALTNAISSAFENLNKALEHLKEPTLDIVRHIKNDRDLQCLYTIKEWQKIISHLDELEKKLTKKKETKKVRNTSNI